MGGWLIVGLVLVVDYRLVLGRVWSLDCRLVLLEVSWRELSARARPEPKGLKTNKLVVRKRLMVFALTRTVYWVSPEYSGQTSSPATKPTTQSQSRYQTDDPAAVHTKPTILPTIRTRETNTVTISLLLTPSSRPTFEQPPVNQLSSIDQYIIRTIN